MCTTLETVFTLTAAAVATSRIVGRPVGAGPRRPVSFGASAIVGRYRNDRRGDSAPRSGQAQDDLRVSLLAEPVLENGVDLGDFLVESDHRAGQPDDHDGSEPLAGQGRVLRCAGPDRDCGDSS
ncbi:hypothetical protein FHX82_006536 [Amycolatopsis bartoniae]|uniref:Uncharacterized protein n=1 Tax=Amycolatopsis bartoniae TaxID=941986 RepID=A0A8H9MDX6_9PSEU|nr:hypothetical protein [Amycolatopsis bartoniae]MBB2939450.1 hypothetical protein [Amycolatopsis bartoniae]GHF66820.1 hypothetical protein GCM10017566_45810 [Amycolatopsis bartoniae]